MEAQKGRTCQKVNFEDFRGTGKIVKDTPEGITVSVAGSIFDLEPSCFHIFEGMTGDERDKAIINFGEEALMSLEDFTTGE